MDALGHVLRRAPGRILLRRQGGIGRVDHVVGRQFGLRALGQQVALRIAQRIARVQGVVVACDGGVILQCDALGGFVQRDLQPVFLAFQFPIAVQAINECVAQLKAVALLDRLDID